MDNLTLTPMKSRYTFVLLFAIALSSCTNSQSVLQVDTDALIQNHRGLVHEKDISKVDYDGKAALHIEAGPGAGIVWLEDKVANISSIELDLRGRNEIGASFVGVTFNGDESGNHEVIYLRPFNFTREGRTKNAIQYTYEPEFPWQPLREKHPGVYESDVNPAPNADDWLKLRIEIDGSTLKAFVNNMDEPDLVVERINTNNEGRIGFWTGNGSEGDFANLRIEFGK